MYTLREYTKNKYSKYEDVKLRKISSVVLMFKVHIFEYTET